MWSNLLKHLKMMKNSERKRIFRLDKKYLITAFALFIVEVLIALYLRDSFLRPYGGDFLVVIMLYCLLRGFSDISVINAVFGVLIFSFAIELAQYFKLIKLLHSGENYVLSVILGNHFEWLDILAYCLAATGIVVFEKAKKSSDSSPL